MAPGALVETPSLPVDLKSAQGELCKQAAALHCLCAELRQLAQRVCRAAERPWLAGTSDGCSRAAEGGGVSHAGRMLRRERSAPEEPP